MKEAAKNSGLFGCRVRMLWLLIFCFAITLVSSAAEPQSNTLRWMGHWKGEGGREKLVTHVLGEFRFLHPELEVEFQFARDILPEKSQEAAADYLVEMLQAGRTDWDVIWLDSMIYAEVAKRLDDRDWGRKYLVDFSEIPGFPETQKDFLVKGSRKGRYTGGVLVGPYIEGFFYTAWYNRDLAKKLGIQIREEGMTEQDLIGYVKQVHAYNQTAHEPVSAFLNMPNSGSMSRLFYGLLASSCIVRDEPQVTEQDYARTESVFRDLAALCPFGKNPGFSDWPEAARFMLQENRALFFFDATWRYGGFQAVCPDELNRLGLAQMPAFEGRACRIGGHMPTWAVLKNAPGRDAGIELLRFLSRPAIAQRWVRDCKCPTGLKGEFDKVMFGRDRYSEYQRTLHAATSRLFLDPMVFGQSFLGPLQRVDTERVRLVAEFFCDEGAVE